MSALAPGISFVRMHAKMQICGMYDLHGIPRMVECTDKGMRGDPLVIIVNTEHMFVNIKDDLLYSSRKRGKNGFTFIGIVL